MDLQELFRLNVAPLELVVRGTAMYWFLFLLFRFVLRRGVGQVGVSDILLLVIVADAAQNGMSGDYRTVAEGFVLVATLVGWSLALDTLAYRLSRQGIASLTEVRIASLEGDRRISVIREDGVQIESPERPGSAG